MSSAKDGAVPSGPLPKLNDVRIAIVTAEWNRHITGRLLDSAVSLIRSEGYDVDCFDVPGTVELTFGASALIEESLFDAVIVFGCVVRGDTPHFDYVCQSVTQGITALNADCDTPVIFGVLTVENEAQALDRIAQADGRPGPAGDKGREAAEAAIKMVAFKRALSFL